MLVLFAIVVFLPAIFGFFGGWFLPQRPYRILLAVAGVIALIGVAITVFPMIVPSSGHVPPDEAFADGFIRLLSSAAVILAGLSLGMSALVGRGLSR